MSRPGSTLVGPPSLALIGNPNCGKTTVFNALTGLRQKVGNYPGVTVERRVGKASHPDVGAIPIIDLPGTYSLAQRAPDEEVAVRVILGRFAGEGQPDVLINVCDASNLARNLYLTTQLLELGRPVVVALNMMDVARSSGSVPDAAALEACLGTPVVALEDHGEESMGRLIDRALAVAGSGAPATRRVPFPARIEAAVERLAATNVGVPFGELLRELSCEPESGADSGLVRDVAAVREGLERDDPGWWTEEPRSRYAWIDAHLERVRTTTAAPGATSSDRVDSVLLHRFFGPVAFVGVMALVFQSIFTWATGPTELLESGFGAGTAWIGGLIGPGRFRDLVVDGALAGVLNVLVFLPQILILFLFIGILEDSGYMARAAFIMDRVMRRAGLHGRSFVPMMSSFACAIPGIMGARTIESPGARLVTILVAPLMSCSARLPVYTLVIGAFFGDGTVLGIVSTAGLVMLAMYLLGIFAAVGMAWLFRRTLARGETPTLIMELPPYRMPRLGIVIRNMFERGWLFVRKAGTVILTLSVLIWFLQNWPVDARAMARYDAEASAVEARADALGADTPAAAALVVERDEIVRHRDAERLRSSAAGALGRAIEPVIEPLGFDWRIGIGLVASFAAREVLVSTLAQVFSVSGEDEDVEFIQQQLREAPRDDGSGRAYRPLTGLSLLVFFVLACQCLSTVAVVRRETNSWRWPAFLIAYMTTLAWVASFVVYQVGSWMGF